ncbi:unnamed protein product [Agarophyton chilense]
MSQSLCCFATCLAGALTMLLFGIALKAHNPFLGFEGDFDEAAASCFKTAFVFLALSGLSLLSFVLGAVRSKMSPPPITRVEYEAV